MSDSTQISALYYRSRHRPVPAPNPAQPLCWGEGAIWASPMSGLMRGTESILKPKMSGGPAVTEMGGDTLLSGLWAGDMTGCHPQYNSAETATTVSHRVKAVSLGYHQFFYPMLSPDSPYGSTWICRMWQQPLLLSPSPCPA